MPLERWLSVPVGRGSVGELHIFYACGPDSWLPGISMPFPLPPFPRLTMYDLVAPLRALTCILALLVSEKPDPDPSAWKCC